jgi:hypothetical protein
VSPRPKVGTAGWVLAGSWACLIAAATTAIATAPTRPASPESGVPSALTGAAGCARTFTEDYVAWLARRRSARQVRGASAALRQRLAAEALPPRRGAQRRLRIVELHTQLRPDRADATARVLDAAGGSFELTLSLGHGALGWEVRDATV